MSLSSNLRGSANFVWSTNEPLGQGATGAVYKCRHKRSGELFAVKTFNSISQLRPWEVQAREFEVVRKLRHPNIVAMVAIEEEQNSHSSIIVMELCDCSLYNLLDRPENSYGLSEEEFLLVLKDIAEGMKYLRDQNIVHRDIKPGNIMRCVLDNGRSQYKLTDFGAARELEEEQQFMSLYGTEEYLYPDMYERAVLRRPMGQRFGHEVDLWSLGVTLYHTASGQLPFKPFGGRRNKDTMHRITVEKESGVISGVQHVEGGPIEYSRELPKTCQLSQGLKSLITPLLAGLLESNGRLMWTFEQFQTTVKIITEKRVLHVFSTCTCECLYIYIDRQQTFAKFQELVAEQTDTRASHQYLLYQHTQLAHLVQPMQKIEKYPETSFEDPIYLFFEESSDFPRSEEAEIPKNPKTSSTVQLDQDAAYAKMCTSIGHLTKRIVGKYILKQKLLGKAMLMYIQVIIRETKSLNDIVKTLSFLVRETQKRLQLFITSNQHVMRAMSMSVRGIHQDQIPNELVLLKQDLEDAVGPLQQQMQEMTKSCDELSVFVQNKFYKGVVLDDELSGRWRNTYGCLDADQCVSKVDVLLDQVSKTCEEFKKHKQMRKLPYNDEQIHKYEKNRMYENCTKISSLVNDHCYPNTRKVFSKFADAFAYLSRFHSKIIRCNDRVNSLTTKEDKFTEDLDKRIDTCSRKIDSVALTLNPTASERLLPHYSTPIAVDSAVTAGQGAVTDAQKIMNGQARNIIKEIKEGMQQMTNGASEARKEMQLSYDLIQELERLQFQNGHVASDEEEELEKPLY